MLGLVALCASGSAVFLRRETVAIGALPLLVGGKTERLEDC